MIAGSGIRMHTTLLVGLLAFALTGCESTTAPTTRAATAPASRANEAAPPDPFVGYFAHPAIGDLELSRTDDTDAYRGKLLTLLGAFPVEGRRDGNVVRAKVIWREGVSEPLELEHTSRGFVLTTNGIRIDPPLQRYENEMEFSKWMKANPKAMQIVPTTRPAK
ncbi:MAG: hypothetical protein H7Z14_21640 [Anaerolineae bacterium]|nr:hypothetical protein [Phycisphaerae bacterium]